MKINGRIIYLAHHEKVKEKTLVGGKSFDFILETMSGPKRRIALQIIHRPYETLAVEQLREGSLRRPAHCLPTTSFETL